MDWPCRKGKGRSRAYLTSCPFAFASSMTEAMAKRTPVGRPRTTGCCCWGNGGRDDILRVNRENGPTRTKDERQSVKSVFGWIRKLRFYFRPFFSDNFAEILVWTEGIGSEGRHTWGLAQRLFAGKIRGMIHKVQGSRDVSNATASMCFLDVFMDLSLMIMLSPRLDCGKEGSKGKCGEHHPIWKVGTVYDWPNSRLVRALSRRVGCNQNTSKWLVIASYYQNGFHQCITWDRL